MALSIGITGNIGAGKTTVCRQFERLGVPVYYADARAKLLMTTDEELRKKIASTFGKDTYDEHGQLNRTLLASRVFADPAALKELNAMVHPVVARDAKEWNHRQTTPYSLHEAAIIYEIGSAAAYNAIVVVTCPLETRFQRVAQRDGLTREEFLARADRQWPDDKKAAAADYTVDNGGTRLLLPQVLKLDAQFRMLAPEGMADRT